MPDLSTSARNAAAAAVVALIDGGSGPGDIVIRASTTVLVTFPFDGPSFGSPSGGSVSALGFPKFANAVAAGVADNYLIRDSNGTTILSGSVGESAADLILDNTDIANGQEVRISAIIYTQPVGV